MKVKTFLLPEFHATVTQDKVDLYEHDPVLSELIKLAHTVFNGDAGRQFLQKLMELYILNDNPHTPNDTIEGIMWREGRNDFIRTMAEWSLWGKGL